MSGLEEEAWGDLGVESQDCMAGMESEWVRPTAVTRSPWERAALTMERPMWPVAPKT